MILDGILMLSTILQAAGALATVVIAWRFSARMPFLTTVAVIALALLVRRLTAWAVMSSVVRGYPWAQRTYDDMQIINNVVIPLFVGMATLTLAYELYVHCSPRRQFARGALAHER